MRTARALQTRIPNPILREMSEGDLRQQPLTSESASVNSGVEVLHEDDDMPIAGWTL